MNFPIRRQKVNLRFIDWFDERTVQLISIAQIVTSLGFFISGIVLLITDYKKIPDTAEKYRVWSIAMTCLFGVLTIKGDSKRVKVMLNYNLQTSRSISLYLFILSLVPLVVFIIGCFKVIASSTTTPEIIDLYHWSICIVVYSLIFLCLFWVGSVSFYYHYYLNRGVPVIDTSQLI
jgi:hypothetical protein